MKSNRTAPLRIIDSVAPMRIRDNGGRTDTWFAGYGRIFNIAVYPCAEVQMKVYRRRGKRPEITINAGNYGQLHSLGKQNGMRDKHPPLEAVLDHVNTPGGIRIEVPVQGEAPSGCSTGTSAAVSVARIWGLDCLTPGRMTRHEVALAAQKIEAELLHQQCGIQDQLASTYGGINCSEMYSYPNATISQLQIPIAFRVSNVKGDCLAEPARTAILRHGLYYISFAKGNNALWWDLKSRLDLVSARLSRSSSEVHKEVILELDGSGPDCPKLQSVRVTAQQSKDARHADDFDALPLAMQILMHRPRSPRRWKPLTGTML